MSLTFASPLLLVGLLAAGIPVVLHLIATLRAPRVYWPSLQFLTASLQRTRRRRSVQRWLLLLLRALGMGLLAIALAQPVVQSRQQAARLSRDAAVAIVLDNSLSMAAQTGDRRASRFETARQSLTAYLTGEDRPALATLLLTNGPDAASGDLTDQLPLVRQRLIDARVIPERASLAASIIQAGEQLEIASGRQRVICLLTDLQSVSTEGLADITIPDQEAVSLVVIDVGSDSIGNVGLTDISLAGQAVAGNTMAVTASLVNSGPDVVAVDVSLYVDNQVVGASQRVRLGPAGRDDARQQVTFPMPLSEAPMHVGQVVIETPDSLPADNVRRFAIAPADDVRALIVHGVVVGAPAMDQPGALLAMILNPFDSTEAGPIRPRTVPDGRFSPDDLLDVDIAFFCEVTSFSAEQAAAIEQFVRAGHTAVFLLGEIDTVRYNEALASWLPVTLGSRVRPEPSSQVDDYARDHALLAGLYGEGRPWPAIRVDQHVAMERSANPGRTIIATPRGEPIVVTGPVGEGTVMVSALPDRSGWSNAMTTHVMPAMFIRAALLAGEGRVDESTALAGQPVTITSPVLSALSPEERAGCVIKIFAPRASATDSVDLPIRRIGQAWGVTFDSPAEAGVYRWLCVGPNVGEWRGPIEGRFVVNADGSEADLTARTDQAIVALRECGFGDVVLATSLAQAREQIIASRAGRNMWDILAVTVIVVLLIEMFIANRNGLSAASESE